MAPPLGRPQSRKVSGRPYTAMTMTSLFLVSGPTITSACEKARAVSVEAVGRRSLLEEARIWISATLKSMQESLLTGWMTKNLMSQLYFTGHPRYDGGERHRRQSGSTKKVYSRQEDAI